MKKLLLFFYNFSARVKYGIIANMFNTGLQLFEAFAVKAMALSNRRIIF